MCSVRWSSEPDGTSITWADPDVSLFIKSVVPLSDPTFVTDAEGPWLVDLQANELGRVLLVTTMV